MENLANEYVFEKVDIGLVEVSFPLRLEISNLVVYDHRDSILFSAGTLRADPVLSSLQDSILVVDQVVLSGFEVNMSKYAQDSQFNYRYALKTQQDTSGASRYQSFAVNEIIMDGGDFRYHNFHRDYVHEDDGQIDYNHMEVSSIEGRADSLKVDTMTRFHLAFLSCEEQSGFSIQKLATNFQLTNNSMAFNNTFVNTSVGSQLALDYEMNFDNWGQFDDFENLVYMQSQVNPSRLNIDDIKFFSSGLASLSSDVEVSGKFKGIVNGFFVNNLSLRFDEEHYAKADVRISDATSPEEMFIDLKIRESLTEAALVRRYYTGAKIPKAIDDLGQVSTTGQFTGVLNDFVAYANFDTDLGMVNSDIHLQLGETDIENKYSGTLSLTNFSLGELTRNPLLGKVKLKTEIDGNAFKIENVSNILKAKIDYADVNNYRYKNIRVDGSTKNKFFSGEMKILDSNAKLDFSGTIDFRKSIPEFQFKSNIARANLHQLNITKDSVVVSAKLETDFKASDIENLEGRFRAWQTNLVFNDRRYKIKSVDLTARNVDSLKKWVLLSDIANGHLYTNMYLKDIPDVFQMTASQALNYKKFDFKAEHTSGFLDYAVMLNNPEPLVRLVSPDIHVPKGTRISGMINQEADSFYISATGNYIAFDSVKLNDYSVFIESGPDSIKGDVNLRDLVVGTDSLISGYQMKLKGNKKVLFANQELKIFKELATARVNMRLNLEQNDSNLITIDTSQVTFQDKSYFLESDSISWIGHDKFEFYDLKVFDQNQKLDAKGSLKLDGKYRVNANIQNLRLYNFTKYMGDYFESLKGSVNGDVYAHNESGHSVVEADITVDTIDFKGLDIDQAVINSKFNNERQLLSVFSKIKRRDSSELLTTVGGITYSDDSQIDMRFDLNSTPISMFDTMLVGVLSNIEGNISGVAGVKGSTTKPDVYGHAWIDGSEFTVDYLQTRYALSDSLHFNNERILFKDVELVDAFNQKSVLNGSIEHGGFKKFDLNLRARSNNFLALNTAEEDNDLFYGTAFITGNSKFTGPLLKVHMDLNVKTNPGTALYLPIEEETSVAQQSYIRFISREEKQELPIESEDDFSMSLKLDVTEDAEVQLIFDQQLGDVIRARGHGNLAMNLSPGGDFEMFGDYIITEGNYLFTAFDLINKRFKIKPESKVSWVGDPYDAELDLLAIYELKANAYMLVSAVDNLNSQNLSSSTVPVEARASLKGSLLKPKIDLSFEIIDNGVSDVASIKRELNALNLSQEEIDKQVVSLLVLNRFMPVYTGTGGSANAISSGYEASLGDFVSNQVTNWLSTIDEDLVANFTYSGEVYAGNEDYVLSERELELALSYSLFNDRVQVNYAYEFQNNYRPNTEVSYKVNEDGTLRLKLFNRQSQNLVVEQDTKTYGLGLFFRKEFNSIKELFQSKRKKKKQLE